MMKHIAPHPVRSLGIAVLLVAALCPAMARAQAANVQALGLVRQAMEAYSNLNLDQSRAQLDQALALAAQLDKATLARVHVSYGILWIGGFTDNAKGQQSFLVGLCLDSTILVDPLLSTPEIDMMYALSKQQVNPATCQTALAGVVVPGGGVVPPPPGQGAFPPPPVTPPAEPSCGTLNSIEEQKQKMELPIYVELDQSMMGRVARLTAKYAFDANQKYTDLPLSMVGNGYGAMISCAQGKIHEFDPKTITYYVEGYDNQNRKVCTIGTKDMPNEVRMMPEVAIPVEGLPGMPPPKECQACAPWDQTCKGNVLPGIDEPCTKSVGCQEGLNCGESGLCESAPESKTGGPTTFYVNLGVGAGFGYMSKDMTIRQIGSDTATKEKYLKETKTNPAGMAWSGIPARLAVGFFVIPDLSIEVTTRFDVYISSEKQLKSCYELAKDQGQVPYSELGEQCRPQVADGKDEDAKRSLAIDAQQNTLENQKTQIAWLVNARVRYAIISDDAFRLSIFGGVGYGFIKYRIATSDGSAYFPMPGMVDIEVGPAIAYYFTPNVGIIAEVPIDAIVGDGFGLNFDVNVGLSFGF
jgi:hypothetical protein